MVSIIVFLKASSDISSLIKMTLESLGHSNNISLDDEVISSSQYTMIGTFSMLSVIW